MLFNVQKKITRRKKNSRIPPDSLRDKWPQRIMYFSRQIFIFWKKLRSCLSYLISLNINMQGAPTRWTLVASFNRAHFLNFTAKFLLFKHHKFWSEFYLHLFMYSLNLEEVNKSTGNEIKYSKFRFLAIKCSKF